MKNEIFFDSVHKVPMDAPVVQYGANVCYHLTSSHTEAATSTSSTRSRNLFEVLMSSTQVRVQPKKWEGRNYIKFKK